MFNKKIYNNIAILRGFLIPAESVVIELEDSVLAPHFTIMDSKANRHSNKI